ncbi:hypothetical protein ACFFTM_03200 [Pseudoduganella plicata]|uniref:Uncharacterized protein n=1 Tax=Pseudoduganella plicata TaxID=321984 RepID=A0A4P7BG71_9BURK|nr:hypothetical protein [Pseudoduganella plicata]QBQ36429.1 hypothetical protein E1742_09840 [Pseudoduganella plicata]GGY77004.1 hypothetical protein GCM10007388_07220 [Pseudoduganella plicata]
MKFLATFLIAACLVPTARAVEPASARLLGYYSNMQTEGADDPHFVSGYNVALYQREAETFGQVMVAIGSSEPAPATIQKLTYDPKKKLLTFIAEYSSGLASNPVKGAPDREALQVLTFSGVVRPQSISGKVGIRDFYCGQCKPVFKRVTLKRISEMGSPGEVQSTAQ